MDEDNAFSLELCYKYWSESSRESIQNIEFICTSTFVEVFNREMDNNDNSSREVQSKKWTFYHRFELAHF